MEEGAKRRLAGAAVMVLLLVIFVPMLLEEDVESPVSEQEMSAPPRPDFNKGYESSVADDPVEPSPSAFPEYPASISEDRPLRQELPPPEFFEAPATGGLDTDPGQEQISEPEPAKAEDTPWAPEAESEPVAVDEAPPPAPEPAPVPVVVEKTPPAPKPKPAPEPATAPKPAPAKPPAPAQSSASGSSWVIQVASMLDRKRAYALVQDLRAKGFPAYIEEAKVREKLWNRVRVGPELDRKRIESVAASLKAQTGLKVQIQRYP